MKQEFILRPFRKHGMLFLASAFCFGVSACGGGASDPAPIVPSTVIPPVSLQWDSGNWDIEVWT